MLVVCNFDIFSDLLLQFGGEEITTTCCGNYVLKKIPVPISSAKCVDVCSLNKRWVSKWNQHHRKLTRGCSTPAAPQCHVFATGVINDPVEFAIFAYVDTWAGLGGWGGDDDVSFTCTHVTCYGPDVSCTCTHVTCYASHGEGWVGGVGMMTFPSLAHM